jgi:methylmalonyl-CoA/ethylmalonyl-CoA epimerase
MAEPRLERIGQIAIVAKDVDKARDFYRDKMGLRHLFDAPGGLSFFDCGGTRLMISKAEKPEFEHAASILYFSVSDIGANHAEMKARGVQFEDEPHLVAKLAQMEIWMTFFRDSENNVMALMAEVRA